MPFLKLDLLLDNLIDGRVLEFEPFYFKMIMKIFPEKAVLKHLPGESLAPDRMFSLSYPLSFSLLLQLFHMSATPSTETYPVRCTCTFPGQEETKENTIIANTR